MLNFRIGTQIEKEIIDFKTTKVKLAAVQKEDQMVRYAKGDPAGYFFNQMETLTIEDLYYNSIFENGPLDSNKQQKIFMNVGKFRCEVSSKQIDIDTKDGKFVPDDWADPWTAIFMQKDFKEWAKETYLGELINQCVEAFPKYGTVVLKKVGKKIEFVPLQNLRNEQTADSLATATYVIEEHPNMTPWELEEMPNWNTEGLTMKFDQTMTVFERYGYVPLKWLKEANGEEASDGDENKFVDAMVICGKNPNQTTDGKTWHVFLAVQIASRPYREAHWARQHGRWLGLGVMEDLIQNQKAKNIIVNLIRRRLQWSSKVLATTKSDQNTVKNLAKDLPDGALIEVGQQGDIQVLDLSGKNQAEFQQFLGEFEKNSDQKAFTYEVATGESMPSGTPFRLGVVLSGATNTFFNGKRERLGLLLECCVNDFLVPQFIKDMSNKEKVMAMFSNEAGYEVVQEAAMNYIKSEAVRASLLSGQPVDANAITQAIQPWEAVNVLYMKRPKGYYSDVKMKFTFTFVGENVDLEGKLETLKTLYQIMVQKGDPRAEKVLARIGGLTGETLAQFGAVPQAAPPQPQGQPINPAIQPAMKGAPGGV